MSIPPNNQTIILPVCEERNGQFPKILFLKCFEFPIASDRIWAKKIFNSFDNECTHIKFYCPLENHHASTTQSSSMFLEAINEKLYPVLGAFGIEKIQKPSFIHSLSNFSKSMPDPVETSYEKQTRYHMRICRKIAFSLFATDVTKTLQNKQAT